MPCKKDQLCSALQSFKTEGAEMGPHCSCSVWTALFCCELHPLLVLHSKYVTSLTFPLTRTLANQQSLVFPNPPSSMNVRLTPPTAKGYSHSERVPFRLWRSVSNSVGCRCARNSRHSSASSPAPLKSVPGSVPCTTPTAGCVRSCSAWGIRLHHTDDRLCSGRRSSGDQLAAQLCFGWLPSPQRCCSADALCCMLTSALPELPASKRSVSWRRATASSGL